VNVPVIVRDDAEADMVQVAMWYERQSISGSNIADLPLRFDPAIVSA